MNKRNILWWDEKIKSLCDVEEIWKEGGNTTESWNAIGHILYLEDSTYCYVLYYYGNRCQSYDSDSTVKNKSGKSLISPSQYPNIMKVYVAFKFLFF